MLWHSNGVTHCLFNQLSLIKMSDFSKPHVSCRVPQATIDKLKAMADGKWSNDCPSCGRPWDLKGLAKQEPKRHSVLAAEILVKGVDDLYDKMCVGE